MKKYTSSLVMMTLLASGCAMKQKIMDVSVVSMTHANLPDGSKTKEMGAVTGKFCQQSSDKGAIGLFDEAIKAAQADSHADFISNASFFLENGCISLEGTGLKIVPNERSESESIVPSILSVR